ncbi:MAG: hypothetical protein KAQ75_00065, partial [Bacteroidales bacterium]|nr:hypothetical protein [Bacteroidales bacterium]
RNSCSIFARNSMFFSLSSWIIFNENLMFYIISNIMKKYEKTAYVIVRQYITIRPCVLCSLFQTFAT